MLKVWNTGFRPIHLFMQFIRPRWCLSLMTVCLCLLELMRKLLVAGWRRLATQALLGLPAVGHCPSILRDNNQERQGAATSAAEPVKGGYGAISLFGGVSAVLLILSKKFGHPPVAAIIAECDLSLRELVCALSMDIGLMKNGDTLLKERRCST